jgi:hypothetical protein
MTCHRLGGSLSLGIATIATAHSLRLPLSTYTLLQPGALELFAYALCTMQSRQHILKLCGMNYTHVLKETHQYSTSTFTSITYSQLNQTEPCYTTKGQFNDYITCYIPSVLSL